MVTHLPNPQRTSYSTSCIKHLIRVMEGIFHVASFWISTHPVYWSSHKKMEKPNENEF